MTEPKGGPAATGTTGGGKNYFPPGDTTTTTTTSTSSSSSSGSSGPAGPSPQSIANAKATYANLLLSWGIPLTPDVKRFIDNAVAQQWGSAQFLRVFRATHVYQQAFPGIIGPNGTLRMSESSYLAAYRSAKDYAATLGRNLTLQAYGMSLKNGNSPSELKAKLQALDILKSNGQMFQQFSDYLQATGVEKKPLQRSDLLAFVMGQGAPQWEKAWQDAYAANQLAQADITVGRPKAGGDVSYKELDKLIEGAKAQGITPSNADYQRLAQQAKEVLPMAEWENMGISKKDLARLFFGAKGSDVIAAQVQRVLGTYAAAQEPTANPQLQQMGTGTSLRVGTPQQQATE